MNFNKNETTVCPVLTNPVFQVLSDEEWVPTSLIVTSVLPPLNI
jgi:hypothetical protein